MRGHRSPRLLHGVGLAAFTVCLTIAIVGGGVAMAAGPKRHHGSTKPSGPRLPSIISAPRHVRAGQQVVISADVGRNAACRLLLSRHGRQVTHSAFGASASGELEWVWTVPKRVAPGTTSATVLCASHRHHPSVRIRAAGRHRGHLPLARHIRVVPIRSNESPLLTGLGGTAYPGYGTVLVPGSDWFGGHGVDVVSNGRAGSGYGVWQCVNLVTRFVAAEHFGPTIWGNANQLYADANSAYYDHHPNRSGYIPVPGDIITMAGGPYGHVVIVDRVVGNTIYVVEQNASASGRSALIVGSDGFISGEYGLAVIGTLHAKANANPPGASTPPPSSSSTAPPPSAAPDWVAPAGSSPKTYQVYGTGSDGLFERSGPGTSYAEAGWLPDGANAAIACQVQSTSAVNGSSIWDRLTDGYFVADYYINTPVVGQFTPGLAQCVHPGSTSSTGTSSGSSPPAAAPTWHAPAGSVPQSYAVYGTGTDGLFERTGPGSSYSEVGVLPNGTAIQIACQTRSSSSVNGSPIWDLLTTGYFVADYYVNTPVVGNFSPGLAQCVYS